MHVLALDPGKTTGWCVAQADDLVPLKWGEIPLEGTELFIEIMHLLRHCRIGLVIVESVVQHGALTAGKVLQIQAATQIACAIAAVSWGRAPLEIVLVYPEVRKRLGVAPDEVHGDHARDACRLLQASRLP